jgi:shikimate dehydrogenase
MTKNNITKKFAVVGCDIQYSRSPAIHNLFSKITGIKLDYNLISLSSYGSSSESSSEQGLFEDTVLDFFKNDNLNIGLNITVPFKMRAFDMCDHLSDDAKILKAVNTLWSKDGELYGDSTDGLGFITDFNDRFASFKNYNLKNNNKINIVLFGAGGAARSILPSIFKNKLNPPDNVFIINRDQNKADLLVNEFKQLAETNNVSLYSDISIIKNKNKNKNKNINIDVFINSATDKALLDDNIKNIALDLVNNHNIQAIYDLSYGVNIKTKFCELAENNNIKFRDGLGMLVYQAAESFYIWNGVRISKEDLLEVIQQLKL